MLLRPEVYLLIQFVRVFSSCFIHQVRQVLKMSRSETNHSDCSNTMLTSLVSISSEGKVQEGSQLRRTLSSHSHSHATNSPDTPEATALPSAEEIVERRGALKWLPEHGSSSTSSISMIWFIVGSFLAALAPIVPMITYDETNEHGMHNHDVEYEVHTMTSALLIVCGLFYTIGSYALKRAAHIPPQSLLMPCFHHTSTDELLGSWCFFVGTFVTLPICMCVVVRRPAAYFLLVGASVIFLACIICAVFCHSCYPSLIVATERGPLSCACEVLYVF